MFNTRIAGLALAALGLAAAHPVAAQTTVYNFQVLNGNGFTYTGGGAYFGDSTASTWNGALLGNGTGTFTNIKASDGTTQSTTLGLTITGTGDNYYQPVSSGPGALFGSYAYDLAGTPGSVSLTGLGAGEKYTLDLYGMPGGYNNRLTAFTLNGVTQDTTATGDNTTFVQTVGGTLGNYTQFTGTTDATGALTIGYTGVTTAGDGKEGDVNGLQLALTPAAAPEPSEFAEMGLGVLGLAALGLRARRRSLRA